MGYVGEYRVALMCGSGASSTFLAINLKKAILTENINILIDVVALERRSSSLDRHVASLFLMLMGY